MKILYLVLLFICASIGLYSQSTLPLRADTVTIEKVGGNANFKLKDASRDTLGGILTNIGGGVYRGKKPRKLTDTSFIVGNDTINIKSISALIATNGVMKRGDTIKAGTPNGSFNDSSIIWYNKTHASVNAKFTQLVISNVGYDSIPTIYQAAQGVQSSNYNPSQIILNRKYNEATNDTLQMQYGGGITMYDEWRADSGSTRFKYNNKDIWLPNKGLFTTNRFYPPRDSVNVYTGNDGTQGSSVYSELGIGDTWGYNMHLYNLQLPTYPVAIDASKLDLQRNLSRGRLRKITGTGIASYFANFKNYQGAIHSSTVEEGSYHSKYYGFFAAGEKDDNATDATKAKVLLVVKADTVIGFFADSQYTAKNSVYNGYGFVQSGINDGNYFGGRLRIGGSWPTRNNGWLRYNLEAPGSTRTDSIYNLYQKFDSTGRIVFTSKNSSAYNAGGFGRFMISARSTLDSTADGTTAPGGIEIFRNYTDYKYSASVPQAGIDNRVYFNLSANRSTTLGQCDQCINNQYYGYSQIIMGANSSLATQSSTIPHTIYLARNEIYGTSSGSHANASQLDLVSFGGVFHLRSNLDSLKTATQFIDYGIPVNQIARLGTYASFKSTVLLQANADSTFGFLQTALGVRNRFWGTMELPSLALVNDTTNYKVVVTDANGKLFKGNWSGSGGGSSVSSISNSDGTLTISPTTGASVASVNLAHANTWTAQQNITVSGQTGMQINMSNTADGTYGINFNRSASNVENAFNYGTNNTAEWFFGEDNNSTSNFYVYDWTANKYVLKFDNSTGDVAFGNSLTALVVKNDGSQVSAASLAGTGTRLVTAGSGGDLSATTIVPSVYTALLTQSGTAAPTATVLGTNTIGAIVWTRTSAGVYVGTLSSAFTANKTWLMVGTSDTSAGGNIIFLLKRTGNNTVQLFTSQDGVNGTDVFTNLSIEIRVYP